MRRTMLIAAGGVLMTACTSAGVRTPLPAPNRSSLTSLEDAPWRVAAVNGRETPTAGDYSLRFQSGSLSAKFGCNGMGGSYRFASGLLTVEGLHQTLMGCPEPASSFEAQGSAILRQPMRIGRASNGDVMLANSAGTITLVPIVTVQAL